MLKRGYHIIKVMECISILSPFTFIYCIVGKVENDEWKCRRKSLNPDLRHEVSAIANLGQAIYEHEGSKPPIGCVDHKTNTRGRTTRKLRR